MSQRWHIAKPYVFSLKEQRIYAICYHTRVLHATPKRRSSVDQLSTTMLLQCLELD